MTIRLAAKVRNQQTTFYVTGDSGNEYIVHNKRNVVSHRKVWTCNCLDFTERRQFNGTYCKHIVEVQVEQAKQAMLTAAVATQAAAEATPVEASVTVKQLIDSMVSFLNTRPREEAHLLWDILSALRGPDAAHSEVLKEITTARVRGAVGLKPTSFAIVDTQEPIYKDMNVWDMTTELSRLYRAEYHFAKHYGNAVKALKALGYIK